MLQSMRAEPATPVRLASELRAVVDDPSKSLFAPGAFFTISVIAQFADERMGFTCGGDPSLVNLQLRSDSGSAVNIRTVRLPAGFGNTGAGCEPIAAVLPQYTALGPADVTFSYLQISAAVGVRMYATWLALVTAR